MKYWVLAAGVLVAAYASFVIWRRVDARSESPPAVTRSATVDARQAVPDGPVAPFELTDQAGKPFSSTSLDGKVWVASFFFTNCPAVCWRMNQALAAWQQTHPHSDVRFVSITCDPAHDTPEALAKYAEHFKADAARWTFLTGDMQKIQAVGQDSFKVAVVEGDHTDRAVVVDRQGRVRGRFRLTEPDQAEMLDRLLSVVESEPAPKQNSAPAPQPAKSETHPASAPNKVETAADPIPAPPVATP